MKLSILIPSVFERRQTFLPKCLDMVYSQYDRLSPELKKEVEILVLVDNKTQALGDKRNVLIDIAQGEYVVFIDDDDKIADTYMDDILKAAESKPDVICFKALVTINGSKGKICKYSRSFKQDRNTFNGYERLPNHIPAIKRTIALQVPFPSIKYGEDRSFARMVHPLLKTEVFIDKVLYYYHYNELTTIAQEDVPAVIRKRKLLMPAVADVVILSNGKTRELREMTQNAIDSIILGANGLNVNVITVEQQRDIAYKGADLIWHNGHFNYSAFNNIGAAKGKAEWIVFSNNDIIAKNGWLHELLGAGHDVVSSHEPTDIRQRGIKKPEKGYINGKHLSPWFFMIKRALFDKIGGWDDDIIGWYSDDALIAKLKKEGVAPMIVPTSIVEHLGSVTTLSLTPEERSDFAWSQLELYNRKYNDNKFITNPNFLAWKKAK